MAYIQYAKPGDNGTWTMIEQAGAHSEYGDYDFSYWVRTMYIQLRIKGFNKPLCLE